MKNVKSLILTLMMSGTITGCGVIEPDLESTTVTNSSVRVATIELCTESTQNSSLRTCTTQIIKATTTTTTTTTLATTTESLVVTEPSSVYVASPTEDVPETPTESETSESDVVEYAELTQGAICPITGVELQYTATYYVCDYPLTIQRGVADFGGHHETYYSERILPGPGLGIPGRHHGDDGTIRDEDGYICVAADPGYLAYGSIVLTTLGPGKVYDKGCAWGTVDIYTCW